VIAARYSIIADVPESRFIVNGKHNMPCQRGRGGGGGAKLRRRQPASTPSANFVKNSKVWAMPSYGKLA
jgi:hypothetical protein